MKSRIAIATVLLTIFAAQAAFAEQTATTEDGRKVLLKDDGTWEYVDDKKDDAKHKKKVVINAGTKNAAERAKHHSLPRVVPGAPTIDGSIPKKMIRRVIRAHRREIQYCYEKSLRDDPDLAGKVEFKFTISDSGDVIAAMVKQSSLDDRDSEDCMTSKIRRWIFPEPSGGGIVIVTYPFEFSVQKSE